MERHARSPLSVRDAPQYAGQRNNPEYRSPAGAQNAYVRQELHDGIGWRADKLALAPIERWVDHNVSITGGLRKFSTNFRYFFEQAQFRANADGYVITYAHHWAPLARRLFFDRYRIDRPNADVDELVVAAQQRELHKLVGLSPQWQDEVVPGAALTYVAHNADILVATTESEAERASASGPAGRRTSLVNRLN